MSMNVITSCEFQWPRLNVDEVNPSVSLCKLVFSSLGCRKSVLDRFLQDLNSVSLSSDGEDHQYWGLAMKAARLTTQLSNDGDCAVPGVG
mmetsp:Transcript_17003/g.34641  ORF Transcript_17003/g.34641 Transcript_17003/m.34641 type:complete len:90 (-) Transcript_17003:240-509(-)